MEKECNYLHTHTHRPTTTKFKIICIICFVGLMQNRNNKQQTRTKKTQTHPHNIQTLKLFDIHRKSNTTNCNKTKKTRSDGDFVYAARAGQRRTQSKFIQHFNRHTLLTGHRECIQIVDNNTQKYTQNDTIGQDQITYIDTIHFRSYTR